MHFFENSRVFTAQDENLGKIDRIVIDPIEGEVTHLVVRKGLFLPEDKVIPISDVATATEERVNLRTGVDPEKYEPFEETYFVPLNPTDGSIAPGSIAAAPGISPVAWYGPYGGVAHPHQTHTATVSSRNIPERAVALEPGAPVLARGLEQVGTVEQVIATEDGKATHVVVNYDIPGPNRAVPITFVERIGDSRVHLGVDSATLGALPPIDPNEIPATPASAREDETTVGGYHLQTVLGDLVDLTLQIQHVRWNLSDEDSDLRRQFDDFDALVRAGADEVAAALRRLGVAPDGRLDTVYQDLTFPPLTTGPFDAHAAIGEFAPRLAQLAGQIRDSVAVTENYDEHSTDVLQALSAELLAWTETFRVPA